jgi:hypothetical protein
MSRLNSHIRVTDIQIGDSVHFLDIAARVVPCRVPANIPRWLYAPVPRFCIETDLYRKDTDLIVLGSLHSATPMSTKLNTILSQATPFIRLTSEPEKAGHHIRVLLESMRLRGITYAQRRIIWRKCQIWFVKYLLRTRQVALNENCVGTNQHRHCTLRIPIQFDLFRFRRAVHSIADRLNPSERNRVGTMSVAIHSDTQLVRLLFQR